jgi:hypothetical protein
MNTSYKTGTLLVVAVETQPEVGIAKFLPTGVLGVIIPAEEEGHVRIKRDIHSQIMSYADGKREEFVFYQPIIVCDSDQINNHEPYYSKRQNLIFDGGTNWF